MEEKFIQAFTAIKEANKILILTHERPDGDALSSVCAIIEVLEIMGKNYTAFSNDELSSSYSFLPHYEKITTVKNFSFTEFDLIIVLDCGSISRTKMENEIKNRTANQIVLEIDHHPKVNDYADIEIRDVTSSATSEIIYTLLKTNGFKLTKNIAHSILTGISTDTGNFIHPSTSEKTINMASQLLLEGARLTDIIKNTKYNKTVSYMKLWGVVLNNLTINKKYNIAFSILGKEDLEKYGVKDDALDDITSFLNNLYGVNFILFLKEEEDGIKGSLRTAHNHINLTCLASHLGGGGHQKASGFKLEAKLKKQASRWEII